MATAVLQPSGGRGWSAPVYPADVTTPAAPVAPKYTDAAVLSIVVQDYERASAWLNDRRWPLQWNESDVLYQSPRSLSVFEGSSVTRSNVSRFTVKTNQQSFACHLGGYFFGADTVRHPPRPSTSQDTVRAWKELISEQLDRISFKQECSYGIQSMVNGGTVIVKVDGD